jgi:hypothetical protein
MSIHRPRRIGRTTAQRLLRGEAAGFDRLAELLATAAAPAGREELLGEEAAVSVFREAHTVLPLRKQPTTRTGSAKGLMLKVAAAVLTVSAAGGVALAAGTGKLPGSGDGSVAPATRPTPGNRPTGTHRTAKPSPSHDVRPGTGPSPSLAGLCHAYRSGAADNPGKALDNPAFTHLITVAGGKDKVTAYCTTLLKTHPTKGRASSHPTGAPSTHHTAGSAHPTGPRKTHPTKATHHVH